MLARLFICVLLITGSGSACIMVPSSPTHLRGNAVFGRFTYEGKPLKNASIQLRTAKGRLVGRTTADANGAFRFNVRSSGVYEVRILKPSAESFKIQFDKSTTASESFNINFFADYCYRISVASHAAHS